MKVTHGGLTDAPAGYVNTMVPSPRKRTAPPRPVRMPECCEQCNSTHLALVGVKPISRQSPDGPDVHYERRRWRCVKCSHEMMRSNEPQAIETGAIIPEWSPPIEVDKLRVALDALSLPKVLEGPRDENGNKTFHDLMTMAIKNAARLRLVKLARKKKLSRDDEHDLPAVEAAAHATLPAIAGLLEAIAEGDAAEKRVAELQKQIAPLEARFEELNQLGNGPHFYEKARLFTQIGVIRSEEMALKRRIIPVLNLRTHSTWLFADEK